MSSSRLLPVAVLASFALLFPVGCASRSTARKDADTAQKRRADPWPQAINDLRNDPDAAACRRVLSRLGSELSASPDSDQPDALNPEDETRLTQVVPLEADDLAEIRSSGFTALDGAYLSDCLYLNDAAKAAIRPGSTPAEQAESAFEWVCRQVELRPWVLRSPQALFVPALPPTAVLQRGSGSGLERAYVFLALLQQLGIDGCLIGGPDAVDRKSSIPFTSSSGPSPTEPFWAVGARVGGDVLVFDPWRGTPITGPGGKGIATLSQIMADPGLVDAATAAADQVRSATPYLAIPLSAAAPRLVVLERKLNADRVDVRLVADPAALRDRFSGEAKLPDVRFWNPPGDPFSYTRGWATFLPAEEGGRDDGKPGQRLIDRFKAELLPPSVFTVPDGLTARDAIERLVVAAADSFGTAFLAPPTPRERLQRGLYFEAIPVLVRNRDRFAAARDRTKSDANRGQAIREWVQRVNEAYLALGKARLNERSAPELVGAARADVERLWSMTDDPKGASPAGDIVAGAVSDAGVGEATYLLALCKHELAEAAQARYDVLKRSDDPDASDRAKGQVRDAWADARDWWRRYEPLADAQDAAFPGRAEHYRQLARRADRLAAETER